MIDNTASNNLPEWITKLSDEEKQKLIPQIADSIQSPSPASELQKATRNEPNKKRELDSKPIPENIQKYVRPRREKTDLQALILEQGYKGPNRARFKQLVKELGEIRSTAIQNKWGTNKREKLEKLLKDILTVPVKTKDLILRYAEIDAFSQGKFDGLTLPVSLSSRNMGKNDIWIAATASVLQAKLLTTDSDFDHLAGVFLDIEKCA